MIDEQQKLSKSKINGESVGSIQARQGECCSSPIGSPASFMYRGYFPIWRKIVDWGWYKEPNTMRVFFHLLITANYKESNYLGVKIYPGQVVTGRKALAFSIGITERQVRTALKHLKATSEVSIKNLNKFSIITLNNWGKYTLTTSEMSEESPASDQQVTTSNNYKERKESNKVKSRAFAPPTTSDVIKYCTENKYTIDANRFIDFYESKGWMVGKNKMKDWRAAVRNWSREKKQEPKGREIPKEPIKPLVRPTYTKEQEEERIKVMADLKSKLKI